MAQALDGNEECGRQEHAKQRGRQHANQHRNAHMGIAVLVGMLTATLLGVFLTPAFFIAIERLSHRRQGGAA